MNPTSTLLLDLINQHKCAKQDEFVRLYDSVHVIRRCAGVLSGLTAGGLCAARGVLMQAAEDLSAEEYLRAKGVELESGKMAKLVTMVHGDTVTDKLKSGTNVTAVDDFAAKLEEYGHAVAVLETRADSVVAAAEHDGLRIEKEHAPSSTELVAVLDVCNTLRSKMKSGERIDGDDDMHPYVESGTGALDLCFCVESAPSDDVPDEDETRRVIDNLRDTRAVAMEGVPADIRECTEYVKLAGVLTRLNVARGCSELITTMARHLASL